MAEIFIKNLSFHYADDQRTIWDNPVAEKAPCYASLPA